MVRIARYSYCVKAVIIVLQRIGVTLDVISTALNGLEEEFTHHGFQEIRLANHSRE
ncbi:hypothetical protein [Burkholderia sp. PU8-34]